jgi:RimJ/RimL family protein N-acetyltransferase
MTPEIYTRRLNENDLEVFFQIRLEALKDSPTSFLTSYEEEFSYGKSMYAKKLEQTNINELFFGAFLKEDLIGVVAFYRSTKASLAHKYTLWGTYIQPQYRQKLYGKLMLKTAIATLTEITNCKAVYLAVRTTNKAALNLYETCGFKIWGTEPCALIVNGKPYKLSHMSLILKN